MEPDPPLQEPRDAPRRSVAPRVALLVGAIALVVVVFVTALPFGRELTGWAGRSMDCAGMTDGHVEYPKSAKTGWAGSPSEGPPYVTITYLTGSRWEQVPESTGRVQRDLVDPPLMDGEPVSFRGEGTEIEITRAC